VKDPPSLGEDAKMDQQIIKTTTRKVSSTVFRSKKTKVSTLAMNDMLADKSSYQYLAYTMVCVSNGAASNIPTPSMPPGCTG
jgi:hypothetical protein